MVYCKAHSCNLFPVFPFHSLYSVQIFVFSVPMWLVLQGFTRLLISIYSSHPAVASIHMCHLDLCFTTTFAVLIRLPESLDVIQFFLHFLNYQIKQIYVKNSLNSLIKLIKAQIGAFDLTDKSSEMCLLFRKQFCTWYYPRQMTR